MSNTRRRSPWAKWSKRRRFEFVMCVGVNPRCCSRDGPMKKMAMSMLDVEAICSRTDPPNVLLTDEGCCKIDAMLIRHVG